jgi:hypothetical protein
MCVVSSAVLPSAQRNWTGIPPSALVVRILAHCRCPIHTSLLEGTNNKIKVLKRMAYGRATWSARSWNVLATSRCLASSEILYPRT